MTKHKHNVLDLESGEITGIALSTDISFVIAQNENITGLSNELGACAMVPTIVIDNDGEVVIK